MTYEEARALIQEHLDYGGSVDSHGLAVAMSAPTEVIADTAKQSDAEFKNFHRLLCERFGYEHDDEHWKRDQLSLIEHLAWGRCTTHPQKIAAPAIDTAKPHSVGDWIWSELMDYCKVRGIAPATADRLFEIVKRARAKFDAAPAIDAAPEKSQTGYREAGVWEPDGSKFTTYRNENLNGKAMYLKEPK